MARHHDLIPAYRLRLAPSHDLGNEGIRQLFHLSPELVLPIECKRPATAKTVGRNVVRVRDQLAERKQRYPHGGIAVIGIDRVIDTQTSEQAIEQERSPNAVATLAEARELSERMLHEWALAVAALGGPRLTEVAPVVMTALFGAVICLEPVVPIILARMAWHTLPNGTPERDDLLATLRSAMQ